MNVSVSLNQFRNRHTTRQRDRAASGVGEFGGVVDVQVTVDGGQDVMRVQRATAWASGVMVGGPNHLAHRHTAS